VLFVLAQQYLSTRRQVAHDLTRVECGGYRGKHHFVLVSGTPRSIFPVCSSASHVFKTSKCSNSKRRYENAVVATVARITNGTFPVEVNFGEGCAG
jgi:hypothetical protein